MKKAVFLTIFLMVFAMILPAQRNPSITIVNNTGYTIWYVYVSATTNDSWGNDFLDDDEILENGASVTVNLPNPINTVNRYDIRLEDSDGDTYSKMNVQVSANSRIVFTFDDFDEDNNEAANFDGPPITIVNNTGYEIFYVYVSESTSDSWGRDRLGSNETIRNGASVSINLPHPINVAKRYDIRLKDSDGDTYTKMNVLVSANGRVVFTFDDYDSE